MTQGQNPRAKGRPRHFAISYHRVQGHPCRRKRETHRGFHIQLSDLPFPHPRDIALTIAAVTSPVGAFPPISRVSTLPARSTDAVAARILSPAALCSR